MMGAKQFVIAKGKTSPKLTLPDGNHWTTTRETGVVCEQYKIEVVENCHKSSNRFSSENERLLGAILGSISDHSEANELKQLNSQFMSRGIGPGHGTLSWI